MSLFTKSRALLMDDQRREAVLMLLLMLVGMVLETLGVGLVIPAITLMMQGDLLGTFPFLEKLISDTGVPTQTSLISLAMLALVGVYLLKNGYLAFLIWKQTSFAFGVQERLSQRLFTAYLRQPYTFHLQRNSAQLMRNITGEVAIFSGVVSSILLLLTESFVLFGVGALLLFVEPMGAVAIVIVLGGAAWGFHVLTKARISRWGMERQYHDGLRIQHLQQGLGGAKDVLLLGREDNFLTQFDIHNRKSIRVWKLQTTLQSYPRLMFELLAVIGLAVLVLTMLGQGRDLASLVPTLGLFAAAAFRLMPSVNRVLTAVQNLRYTLPVVDHLYEEIHLELVPALKRGDEQHRTFEKRIRLHEVVFKYPTSDTPALNGISITINKGELVGLVGTSGSGKSTLVDVILGLLRADTGEVTVDDRDVRGNLRAWQDQIGYVPQSIYLTDDTLRRNIAFGLADEEIDEDAVCRAVKAAQLDEFVRSLPDGLQSMVGERGVRLSGGQRQRIGIARALYHDPSVLVLDEATSALDNATESDVMDAITLLKGAKTIIVVAHRLSTVEKCDRLFQLELGEVVNQGAPASVLGAARAE